MSEAQRNELSRAAGSVCPVQHMLDMVYRPEYSAGYYFTIMHNETAKGEGRPMMNFDPQDPEAVFRQYPPNN